MIKQSGCDLEFVVVATCHSEFVGKIFQEVGANHVICILQSEEVEDEAVITFTDDFYTMVFQQNMHICKAFKQAQLGVKISHGEFQADIFKLLINHEEDNTNKYNKFGPFPPGKY